MAKIYLIPNTGQHKANLHCHTNLSDGRLTPEEMCEGYKKHGYRVMAFSDHEYLTHHPEFNSEDFIAITAYEIGLYTPELPGSWEDTWRDRKCCHLNLYAKNPNEDTHIMFDPDAVPNCVKPIKNSFKHKGEICKRKYEDIQRVIDEARESGYIVCLNHPYWSIQPQWDYKDLKGLFAMEVYNSGGSDLGKNNGFLNLGLWHDYGAMADSGMDIAPIAADDNHNYNGDIENSDSFRGYTMICTDDFTYDGIMTALENQCFYASTGIEIRELSVADGRVHIECSECDMILAYFGGIRWDCLQNCGAVTSADFDIPKGAKHIRIVLADKEYKRMAATKAYRL
ncbi:MAG: PHP domain-containing protein [Clostridia bacterium]|nr:PHP domain-containing protein [Clostridia bacterium]